MPTAEYTLYYHALPFRGVFIRAILEFSGAKWTEGSTEELHRIKALPFSEQPLPLRAPPFIIIEEGGETMAMSQMPAIVNYISSKHGMLPRGEYKAALCLKLVLDASDVLGEISRNGGSMKKNGEYVLWEQAEWDTWRDGGFLNWLKQFEATAKKFEASEEAGWMLGTTDPTLADVSTWALWKTIGRCFPPLEVPMKEFAPTVMGICHRVEQERGGKLAALAKKDAEMYGDMYTGGMVEKGLRASIAAGKDGSAK